MESAHSSLSSTSPEPIRREVADRASQAFSWPELLLKVLAVAGVALALLGILFASSAIPLQISLINSIVISITGVMIACGSMLLIWSDFRKEKADTQGTQ